MGEGKRAVARILSVITTSNSSCVLLERFERVNAASKGSLGMDLASFHLEMLSLVVLRALSTRCN